jgi:hypothetical protein
MFLIFTPEEKRYRSTKPHPNFAGIFSSRKPEPETAAQKKAHRRPLPFFARPEWMIRFSTVAAKARKGRFNESLDSLAMAGYTKHMARKKRMRESAFTLVELTFIMVALAILATAGIFSLRSYAQIQAGLEVGDNLREINLSQKKAVVIMLNTPTTLTYPGPWTTIGDAGSSNTLVGMKLLQPSATTNYPVAQFNCNTMPPTHSEDGRHNDAIKIVGNARSGDGVYDIGPER